MNLRFLYTAVIIGMFGTALIILGWPPHILRAQDILEPRPLEVNGGQVTSADRSQAKPVNFVLDNMDIDPLLAHILGEFLGLNYVVEPGIQGTLSLNIKGNYTNEELIALLNAVFQLHGIAIVEGENGIVKVVRKGVSGRFTRTISQNAQESGTGGDRIHVFQLLYLTPAHMAQNIANFVSPGAVVLPEVKTNSLIVVDTPEVIRKIRKIIGMMDTDFFKDLFWSIYTPVYADVNELAKDLDKIFKTKGLYSVPGTDPGGIQIMPLKTIDGILVISKWKSAVDLAGHWVEELDRGNAGKGSKLYVYTVQNNSAENIAKMLTEIFDSDSTKDPKGEGRKVLVKRTEKAEAKPEGESGDVELSGEVKFIPNQELNLILVKASPRDYAIINEAIQKLDILPRQVMIDVIIVDVKLNEGMEYGIQWLFKQNNINISGDRYSSDAALTLPIQLGPLATDVPLGKGLAGFSYGLFDTAGDLAALIRLIASKTDTNLLASPNVLAVDNKESTIEAGEEVPTKTGETTSSTGTTQSIQYRQTGIILKVKPSINDSGVVRLDVTQEYSEVSNRDTGENETPAFIKRKVATNLVAHDGQTVVIGGLIKQTQNEVSTGIPYLKDIPVLGFLFGGRVVAKDKSELLIAITPHVIRSKEQVDDLTAQFGGRVKGLKEAIDEAKGMSAAASNKEKSPSTRNEK
jgi:general secretion pathway protein D